MYICNAAEYFDDDVKTEKSTVRERERDDFFNVGLRNFPASLGLMIKINDKG